MANCAEYRDVRKAQCRQGKFPKNAQNSRPVSCGPPPPVISSPDMKTKTFSCVIRIVLLFAACGLFAQAPAATGAVPWPVSSPEAQGIDAKALASMLDWMRGSSALEFHSVLIVRNGTLVMEEYFSPWTRERRQNVYSCTKSVLSALYGIAQAEGRLPAVDSRALASLGDMPVNGLDPRARSMTIEQLLSMQSGLQFMRAFDMATAKDQVRYALERPLANEPGTRFLYTSAGPHILSAILQRSVGMSAADYAAKKLFAPMGIRDWSWESDGVGVTIGSTNLLLAPLDLARLGYLFLRRGDWFGTRILPAAWVEASTQRHASPSGMNRAEDSGYGYLWWIDEQWQGYSAHGAAGQFVFVVPRLDLVVVFTSGLAGDNFPVPWDLMRKYVLPSVGTEASPPAPQDIGLIRTSMSFAEARSGGSFEVSVSPKW